MGKSIVIARYSSNTRRERLCFRERPQYVL
jgi:hypothetical protein